MVIAYIDCSAGISGDMCLGALVDAGVSLEKIMAGLKRLPVKGYQLQAKKVTRASLAATKVAVILTPEARGRKTESRRWKDIKKLIDSSSLPVDIKQKGLRIFRRFFEAEARVHGKTFDTTHLHELGALDCIIDIFGTLIGLEALGVEKVYASAVNLGSGRIRAEHGRLPVPAPATVELLKSVPVYSSDTPRFELTTPTGAAILREVTEAFINIPLMHIEKIGNGAGNKDIEEFPNVLRIFIGKGKPEKGLQPLPKVVVIETNIDDMNPQLYEYVMDRLFEAGALDVYLAQVIMKKSRPGVLLTVLCLEEQRAELIDLLLKETTTLGVRFYEASRTVLERAVKKERTRLGGINIKTASLDGRIIKQSPEYEDCKRIAAKHEIPLIEVIRRTTKK